MPDFPIEANGIHQALQNMKIKEESIPWKTELKEIYSTHSRCPKFLEIIWRQLLPILLELKSMRVILFIWSNVSTSSAQLSSIPFFFRTNECKALISTILDRNYLNMALENPWVTKIIPAFHIPPDRDVQPYGICFQQKRKSKEPYSHWFEWEGSARRSRV